MTSYRLLVLHNPDTIYLRGVLKFVSIIYMQVYNIIPNHSKTTISITVKITIRHRPAVPKIRTVRFHQRSPTSD